MDHLEVVLNGRLMGRVEHSSGGRLRFVYDDLWRRDPRSVPLSLSMPLTTARHEHDRITPFLRGLLPDNEEVLRSWGRRYHASPRNAFALLAHVGEDCAGAVQLVRPERLEQVLSSDSWDVEWVDEDEIERRLARLSRDISAWQARSEFGQFSLAGTQPKIALLWENDRWGVPSGRAPTTHILKPPLSGFDGHVENEFFCLELARELGLPAARSHVQRFGSRVAIIVERFDRVRPAKLAAAARAKAATAPSSDEARDAVKRARALSALAQETPILRLHQEDMCQALGVDPNSKYQNEGGPGARDLAELLRRHSSQPAQDVWTFIESLIFNWLIGGTDGHAKNYSILHGNRGRVRLAPLYDLASALAYDDMNPQRLRLAMKVGSKYRLRDISARQWAKLGHELRLNADELQSRLEGAAARLPEVMDTVRERMRAAGLDHPIIERLAMRLVDRARACRRSLCAWPSRLER